MDGSTIYLLDGMFSRRYSSTWAGSLCLGQDFLDKSACSHRFDYASRSVPAQPLLTNIHASKHVMKKQNNGLLRLIAIFKLLKTLTLITVGIGALRLTHTNNAADTLTQLAGRFGFNPGARFLDHALARIANLPPKDFRDLGMQEDT
jgi:hypothetical protein